MNFRAKILGTGLLSVFALAATSTHAATLLGDSIDITLVGGIALEDTGILVGPGVEIQGGDPATAWGAFLFPTESIDIDATSIFMAFDTSLGADAMLTFSNLDFGAGIGGVTLTSTIAPVTQANVSFTGDSITLDLTQWFTDGGAGTLQLDLQAVPIPGAIWLFASTLLGLGVFRRKR